MRADGIHKKIGVFRPSLHPSGHAPFSVRSTGHYRLSPPFRSCVFQTDFVQLCWCDAGVGLMMFDGVEKKLNANQAAIYLPGMRHEWRPVEGIWEFYWLTMDGPLAESMTRTYGLRAGIYDAGPPPVQLFTRLCAALRRHSRVNEFMAGEQAFAILTRAALLHHDAPDALAEKAVNIIHARWNSPAFNVKALAHDAGVDRSILARRFVCAHGIPPAEYIHRLRLQNAIALLMDTKLKVGEIARKCGFTDANYFSRMIRQARGVTPSRLRGRQPA